MVGESKEWEETEKGAECKDRDEQTVTDGYRPVGSFRSSFGDAGSESGSNNLGETEVPEVKVKVWPMTSNCLLRSPTRKLTAQADTLALLGHFQAMYWLQDTFSLPILFWYFFQYRQLIN